ncbi:MAG: 2-oxoacid:acceptor oxidoreductase subunit alpha [Dehalococcoidia bacterium]
MVEAKFMVGGEAGQGVQSIGSILSRIFARGGYHVYSDQDYESRIRGGHNFFRIRVKDAEVGAISESLDVLLALNRESIDLHRKELVDGGMVIFDQEKAPDLQGEGLLGVPLSELAEKEADNKLMANTVALGACLGLVGYEPHTAEVLLKETFGSAASEANTKALHAGHKYAQDNFHGGFHVSLKAGIDEGKLLLNGHESLALGAIAAGCKFMAAYPMTPASSIMEYMASKAKDMDLVIIQPEDEISAVNMAIGASYAGVRSMTATSGSGFCLMVEGLGLAGLTETPVVMVDAQRPGPAVGLPTRTEQGDLQFVLYAHHGDFPRAVLAPSTVEDAFYLAVKAFNLADKYQIPVILLTDHLLATSYQTIPVLDFRKVRIDRGDLYEANANTKPEDYRRHRLTDSGISPRAFPGLSEALVVTDADEHGEEGHLVEDAGIRSSQVEKRLRKYNGLRREIEAPLTYGADKPDSILVNWGSTYGAVRETVDILNEGGTSVAMLQLNQLWPFPAKEVADALGKADASYVVEGNASGQLARLIRTETGIKVNGKILKYDGRPFTPTYIAERVRKGEISPW